MPNMTREEFLAAFAALLTSSGAVFSAPPAPGPTLALIGDSRLNGDWNALLGRTDILNLSVAGSKSSDWLANWQANVAALPSTIRKVIVQYGKNEIDAAWTPYNNAHGIQDVVTIIQTHTLAKAGALGTLPVASTVGNAAGINAAVATLLPVIASQMSSAIPVGRYLEGYGALVSGGVLLPAYTDDGSHLNAAGKAIYKNSIAALEALIP